MQEIVTISRAIGIEIDPLEPGVLEPEEAKAMAEAIGRKGRLADELVERAFAIGPVSSSMRTDLRNGKALEADVRCYVLTIFWCALFLKGFFMCAGRSYTAFLCGTRRG